MSGTADKEKEDQRRELEEKARADAEKAEQDFSAKALEVYVIDSHNHPGSSWIPFGDHPLKLERTEKISMAPAQG